MIPGIVAATLSGGSSGGGGSYPGALAVFDPVLGEYSVDGAVTAADALIDKPGNVVASTGLSIDWDVSGDIVKPIGDLLTKLCLTEFTLVVETQEHEDGGSGNMDVLTIFSTTDTTNFNVFTNSLGNVSEDTQPGVGGSRFVQASVPARPAIRRLAINRSAAGTVISCNGSAIDGDTATIPTPAYDDAVFGAQKGDTDPRFKGYLRRIIVYPLVSDAELPSLSS